MGHSVCFYVASKGVLFAEQDLLDELPHHIKNYNAIDGINLTEKILSHHRCTEEDYD